MESTTLYFKEGESDKIYQASLEPRDGGWVVNFAYGRRGSTLSTGTKTATALSEEDARRVYEKLLQGKIAKGYTAGEDATPYRTGNRQHADIRPQLLNPVETEDLESFLRRDDFAMQQKFDGRRFLLRKHGNEVTGFNRRGIECGIPTSSKISECGFVLHAWSG